MAKKNIISELRMSTSLESLLLKNVHPGNILARRPLLSICPYYGRISTTYSRSKIHHKIEKLPTNKQGKMRENLLLSSIRSLINLSAL